MNKIIRAMVMTAISVVLALSITACNKPTTGNTDKAAVNVSGASNTSNKISISQEVLSEMTKKEYAGRLVGTEGNKKAEKYLVNYMKKIGIKPFSDGDYTMEYLQITADPNKQNTQVVVTFKDGTTKALVHGKDFYTNAATKDINVDLPLEFDPEKVTAQSIAVVGLSDLKNVKEFGDVRFYWHENLLVVGTPETKSNFYININKEMYDELKDKQAVSAKVTADCIPTQNYLNNVVGIIKGKQYSKKALVLTAHFDHVGEQGDFLFSGVVDNASGTATLMSTAAKLVELTKDKVLDYDIIIAAVNSEETTAKLLQFPGSMRLAEIISKNYNEVQNINIDCVGMKQDIELNMGDTEFKNGKLIQSFRNKLTSKQITFNEYAYDSSDHASFVHKVYPAFTIGNIINMPSLFHSTDLTTDDVDFQYLEKLSETVAEFAMDGNPLFAQTQTLKVEEDPNSDEWRKLAHEALVKFRNGKELEYNEEIYFNFGGTIANIGSTKELTTVEEIGKYYPTIKIQKEVDGYKFSSAVINGTEKEYINAVKFTDLPPDRKIDEVFTNEIKVENLLYMLLSYEKDEDMLEICAKKKWDTDKKSDQYSLELTEPSYEKFKLYSMNEGKSFYSICFEKNGYAVGVNIRDIKTFEARMFSESEMKQIIDKLGLKAQVRL